MTSLRSTTTRSGFLIMLTEYSTGEADSSVSRVYSGAGQTRTEATFISADTELMSDSSKSAINRRYRGLRKTRALSARITMRGGQPGFVTLSNTVYPPPLPHEYRSCGPHRKWPDKKPGPQWAALRLPFQAIPPDKSNPG